MFSNVAKYIVGGSAKGLTTLTPSREWENAKGRVITALGASTVAAIAIANQRPASETIIVVEGQDHPSYVVPTALLKAANVKYRISSDGEAMRVRVAEQKFSAAVAAPIVSSALKAARKAGFSF